MKSKFTLLAAVALLALPALALADTIVVNQVGLTFEPAEITILVGDTVEWHWSSGIHTVTNGMDNSDPDAGSMFDDALDSSNTVTSYTFDSAGDVLYFCRFHVDFGMTGLVHVVDTTPAEDSTWGNVKALY
jgi:plastocyanin